MKFKLWLEFNEILNPQLFDKLKQIENDYAGVHFSSGLKIDTNKNTPQLGLNLKPFHFDPIGIYAFPKNYVLNGGLEANTGFSSKEFAFIIIPSSSARILNLNMTMEKAENLLDQMGIGKDLLNNPEIYHKSRKNEPGHMFWGALEHYRNKNALSKNLSWNTLFKKTGYNVLYDPGLAIIHANEPSQIVYLDNKSYSVVDVIRQKESSLLTQFASYFPDFKIFKMRSAWTSKERIISLKKDFVSIQVIAGENQGYLNVKIYGFKESKEWYLKIKSKEDLDKLAQEVKQFLQTAKKQEFSPENTQQKYKIMFDISRLYNLKMDEKYPGSISRQYLSKNDNSRLNKPQIFNLTYSPYNDDISLEITRRGYNNYIFYHQEKPTTAEDTISRLLQGIKEKIKEEMQPDKYYRWGADSAMDFVNFLEKRVFIKRN
jgi:hypothetical protein